MAYLNDYTQDVIKAVRTDRLYSQASAAQYPEYEQSVAQGTYPSPYSLAQQGYKTNTLIYACIERRMKAVSAAPLWIYDVLDNQKVRLRDIPLAKILEHPNERITQRQFWQITSMYQDIAGSAIWEIERNNIGEPIALWPMRPDWCSFLRGDGRPIRAIKYEPPGLPGQEISIDNILLFQYFDPLNPLLKGYSPTMAALKDVAVDNGMNQFLYEFIRNGARFSGLLTTDQDLDDIEAERIRTRWKTQHGGVENWNDIAVLGNGASYQNTSMNLNDMAFPELDGRTEARICIAFEIPPVLLGAKIGLKASTLTNYEQSRLAWYEEWVTPQWEHYAEQFQSQMFRTITKSTIEYNDNILCEFMTKNVAALQKNRDLAFRRAISAARANVFTRDQALAEIGMAPVDNADVYVGPTLEMNASTGANNRGGHDDAVAAMDNDEVMLDTNTAGTGAEEILEQKQFKAFAAKRVKEGKIDDIDSFVWKYTNESIKQELINQYKQKS